MYQKCTKKCTKKRSKMGTERAQRGVHIWKECSPKKEGVLLGGNNLPYKEGVLKHYLEMQLHYTGADY